MTDDGTTITHGVYMFSASFKRWFQMGFYQHRGATGTGTIQLYGRIEGKYAGHMRILPLGSDPPETSVAIPAANRPFTHRALMFKPDAPGFPTRQQLQVVRHPGWRGPVKRGRWVAEGDGQLDDAGTGPVFVHSGVYGGSQTIIRLLKINTTILPADEHFPDDPFDEAAAHEHAEEADAA